MRERHHRGDPAASQDPLGPVPDTVKSFDRKVLETAGFETTFMGTEWDLETFCSIL